MKVVEKFSGLSLPLKILTLLISLPVTVLVIGPLLSIFTLPIVGFLISRNSLRQGRSNKDPLLYWYFASLILIAMVLLLTLRQPQFITDWEGANPLDNQIMIMILALMGTLALFWAQLGWVSHRLLAKWSRKRENPR